MRSATFYAVMVVTLFVPLLAGLYARHTSRRQGLASLVGVPVLAVVYFTTGGAGYGALTPVVSGVLVSALAFFATETLLANSPVLEALAVRIDSSSRGPSPALALARRLRAALAAAGAAVTVYAHLLHP